MCKNFLLMICEADLAYIIALSVVWLTIDFVYIALDFCLS